MILTPKVQRIRYMLDMYVETEPEITDEQFSTFYNMASAGFGKITKRGNTYGAIMNGSMQNNSYGIPGYNSMQQKLIYQ